METYEIISTSLMVGVSTLTLSYLIGTYREIRRNLTQEFKVLEKLATETEIVRKKTEMVAKNMEERIRRFDESSPVSNMGLSLYDMIPRIDYLGDKVIIN